MIMIMIMMHRISSVYSGSLDVFTKFEGLNFTGHEQLHVLRWIYFNLNIVCVWCRSKGLLLHFHFCFLQTGCRLMTLKFSYGHDVGTSLYNPAIQQKEQFQFTNTNFQARTPVPASVTIFGKREKASKLTASNAIWTTSEGLERIFRGLKLTRARVFCSHWNTRTN